jgi:phosphatidyl-myo-inositol dimannoside synthase
MSDSPLRLLFVSHSFPRANDPMSNVGGMQRVALELFSAFRVRTDVKVEELVLRTSWKQTPLRTPPFMVRALAEIPLRVRRDGIQVVVFSSMVTAGLAPLLRRLLPSSVKLAAIVHGLDVTTDVRVYQNLVVPRVFAALDLVMPVSRATAEACQDRGLPAGKVCVVPNGIDLARFEAPVDRQSLRSALVARACGSASALPTDAMLLVSVGRQVRRKGFAWFVSEVMPKLPANIHYWLAGDGPERATIQKAIDDHGLAGRVRLLGMADDDLLSLLYRGGDVFVMPNVVVPGDMEGFGVVMLEAGLSGLPIVASRLEGIQDVVVEGQNGHYVESRDTAGFVRRISSLADDPAERIALSERTAEFTRTRFGWSGVSGRYVHVLTALVAGKPLPEAL